MSPRTRWPRLGLRARITLAFALGSLLLSALLAATVFGIAREQLLNQREASVARSFFVNARLISASTRTVESAEELNALTLLNSLTASSSAPRPVLFLDGDWFSTVPDFNEDAVPASLRELVADGEAGRMRYSYNGEEELAIGTPLPNSNARYFEIVSLEELSETLRSLGVILLVGGLLTTVAGAAFGYYASRRALLPLASVSAAAEAISGGRLDTRLAARADPDLIRLTESFNGMAQALEERIELDARFASDVSHELRSPLMTLSASVEVLKTRRDDLDDRARSAFDLLDADVTRFQKLVDDLLEISRYDAGAVDLATEPVEVGSLVLHAVGAWGGSVAVVVNENADGAVFDGDKRRIERVIANLLENAERYGDGATAVRVDATAETVRICVEDEGPGIPADQRELVFDRFARGAEAGRRTGDRGVGLGLALAREHVALHGGSLRVQDREDAQGAAFIIELPRSEAP